MDDGILIGWFVQRNPAGTYTCLLSAEGRIVRCFPIFDFIQSRWISSDGCTRVHLCTIFVIYFHDVYYMMAEQGEASNNIIAHGVRFSHHISLFSYRIVFLMLIYSLPNSG